MSEQEDFNSNKSLFESNLQSIQCQFFCGTSIHKFDWKNILQGISWEEQEILANSTVYHPIIENKPLHVSYQLAFLKFIIQSLDTQHIEHHDLIYEKYADLLSCSSSLVEQYAYKHYKPLHHNSDLIISLKESRSFIAHGTTGLITWQAGTALADWACENAHRLQTKTVIELGSGTGLTGFIIGKFCEPKKMILTDGNFTVMNLLKENFESNFDTTEVVDVKHLDWNEISDTDALNGIRPDLIVASDVVYDDSLFKPFCRTIDCIFERSSPNCELILAATVRNIETLNSFLNEIESVKFKFVEERIYSPKHLYWDNSIPIKIFTIKRDLK